MQKGENCDKTRKTEWHQDGHLGTRTAPFFRAILWQHRIEKLVHAGTGRIGGLTSGSENRSWLRRLIRVSGLAIAQRAATGAGGSAIIGFCCCRRDMPHSTESAATIPQKSMRYCQWAPKTRHRWARQNQPLEAKA